VVPRTLDLLDADGLRGIIHAQAKIFIGGGEAPDSSQLFIPAIFADGQHEIALSGVAG
jgi:hypothetical protein